MSSIAVVGGTGYAGSAIVAEAARRGHSVISLSRHLPAEPVAGVDYVQGAAADARGVLDGADAIVGALSAKGSNAGTLPEVYTRLGAEAVRTGARLLVVGGFGSLRAAPGAPRYVEDPASPLSALAGPREMLQVLAALRETPDDLDWVFVSPAEQFGANREQGPARGTYRVGDEIALFADDGTSVVEVADFALAIVDEIEQPRHHRAHIGIAY